MQAPRAFAAYLAPLGQVEWVVYAKPPFGGAQQVLAYLGRYTHRVAISNNRLIDFKDGQISFHWKDYRHAARVKTMRLTGEEFVRRFLLHVLPPAFHRIRHFGLLGNRCRQAKLAQCRHLLGAPAPQPVEPAADYRDRYQRLTGVSLRDCPLCGRGTMVCIETLLAGAPPRGPPAHRDEC